MKEQLEEAKYDVRKGADIYRRIGLGRLRNWIAKGKIRRGDALVWRSGLSGWRRPEDLEELQSFFHETAVGRTGRKKAGKTTGAAKREIRKILIGDDEEDLCFLLSNFLSRRDFSVTSAHTAREILACVRTQTPDLLLLDLKLPDGDGLDVLSEVKREYPEIVVNIISAYGSEDRKELAARQGADGFIDKPFTEKEILAVIARQSKEGDS